MSPIRRPTLWFNPVLLLAILIAVVMVGVTYVAPRDAAMGDAQRILYVHVSLAWSGLVLFVVMALTGGMYLRSRSLIWDAWMQSAVEIGWISATLTLVSGSIWAHESWGTWWTWDPRLTTFAILWMFYSGSLLARGSIPDEHRRARLCAVTAVVGLVDLPLVVMATRWFRGIHPVSPDMEPAMRLVLVASILGFTAFFSALLFRRQCQILSQSRLQDL